jgi:predicted Zn-dependent peptidase
MQVFRLVASCCVLVLVSALGLSGQQPAPAVKVPIEYHKLENGLKVVLSRDTSSPTAVVAVYYNIGFRIEPKDRTGFAHLFEHLMFQGSEHLGKNAFISLVQSNGGVLNGSTRFDFTNYFEIVPAHTLETVLWAEADRMRGLKITQENLTNQQGVVKNEVKVNVLNQPYGGFPWLDLPQHANTNWYNAHNFYGDLEDLDAATLEDAQKFFDTYYSPNNAALVVTGDIDTAQALGWIKKRRPTSRSRVRRRRSARTRTTPWRTVRRLPSAITCRSGIRPSTTRWGCSTRSCSRGTTAGCTSRSCRSTASATPSTAGSTSSSATCSTSTARRCGSPF